MKKSTQDNNFIRIITPLGKDAIILNSFEYNEAISELFSLRAKAYFNDQNHELNELIGKEVTILILNDESVTKKPRYINGIVSKATLEGQRVANYQDEDKYKNITLFIEPKMKLTEYRKNCRIFQNKNVEEIISEVLSEHKILFSFKLTKSYQKYSYKVQYEESDLDFIRRLFSEEGLSFTFSHKKASHLLEVFDNTSFYDTGTEYLVDYDSGSAESSYISFWNETQVLTTKATQTSGYNMLKPMTLPQSTATGESHIFVVPSSEHYDYLGETETKDQYASRGVFCIESLQQHAYLCTGQATCRTFTVGERFKFKKHEDKSRIGNEYVLASVNISASVFTQAGQGGTETQGVKIGFTCIDSKTIFRPSISLPKPQIRGIQTAIVTGNKDGEVYIDEHGRIKVKFHWDRTGKYDVNSSCWIRVAQTIAGNGWGTVFHPRVGQEVIVEFINGDPDQPVVTGSLYNGSQIPPYELPGQSSQSGFKSRSVQKGESNFNELRFDDKPGQEHVYLHAEKLFQMLVEDCVDIVVENNKVENVTNNVAHKVGQDSTMQIGKNYSVEVGNGLSIEAGKTIEIKVGGASIQMSSSGEINIKGSKILMNGTSIALKAGKISLN